MIGEAEFGHFYAGGQGFRIDSWGAGPFTISERGKSWLFEDSDRFGPLLISKRGNPLERQPLERHAFWHPYGCWLAQGRQVEPDGKTCIWREPTPTIVRRIDKRNLIIVCNGEEGGRYLDEQGREVGGEITEIVALVPSPAQEAHNG